MHTFTLYYSHVFYYRNFIIYILKFIKFKFIKFILKYNIISDRKIYIQIKITYTILGIVYILDITLYLNTLLTRHCTYN